MNVTMLHPAPSEFTARQGIAVTLLWVLVNLVLLAPLWQPNTTKALHPQSATVLLQEVEWRTVLAGQPSSEWQPATLPHRHRYQAEGQALEYRSRFVLDARQAAEPLWGLCIPYWALPGDVRLDGRTVYAARTGADRGTDWIRPHNVALPAALEAGPHELILGARPPPGLSAQLGELYLAPAATARSLCDDFEARSEVADRLNSILWVLALVVTLLGWGTRERATWWFGLVLVAGATTQLPLNLPLLALTDEQMMRAYLIVRVLIQLPLFFFVTALAELTKPTMARLVPLVVVCEVATVLLLPPLQWSHWVLAVCLLWVALGIGLMGALLGPQRARQRLSNQLLAAALLFSLVTMPWNGFAIFNDSHLGNHVAPASGLIFAVTGLFAVALRLVALDRQKRQAQAELTHQLMHKQSELEHSFELLRRGKLLDAQAQERTRIMRELHDGLGSHLVAASALLSTSRHTHRAAADLVDRCLHELRGTIDSLMPDVHDVAELLGTFRDRIEPVLEAQGIELDWQVESMPATETLNAGERLHVLRIVQEAFANIIKHSGATRVTLRAHAVPPGLSVIDIHDNGQGCTQGAAKHEGRGMTNMKVRAQLLGAELRWSRNSGAMHGCNVRLTLRPAGSPPASAEVIALRPKPQAAQPMTPGKAIDEPNHSEHP